MSESRQTVKFAWTTWLGVAIAAVAPIVTIIVMVNGLENSVLESKLRDDEQDRRLEKTEQAIDVIRDGFSSLDRTLGRLEAKLDPN